MNKNKRGKSMEKLKCASFFAGVGGIDLGFEQSGAFDVIYANEFDRSAADTYETNFDLKVDCRDINIVKNEEIPDFDVMLGGFPCQAFSIAGYREGFDDKKGRGELFFQLERIFKAKKPKIIFLENVKNLVGHDNGNTFKVILECLHASGYHVKYQVMNAMNYGNVPQNRERIYIVAFLDKSMFDHFNFPDPIPLTKTIRHVVDFNGKKDDRYYYTAEKYSFYDELEAGITKKDTVYQWRRVYVRENKSNVCPTLTANMGTGGHNVPLILAEHGIRKLTPKECFLLQGFPDTYKLPDVAPSHLYKQAGNSVVVPVIQRIAETIAKVLKD